MQNRANIIGWLAILLNACAQLLLAPVIKSKMGAAGLGVWHLIFQTFIYLQLIDFGWSNGIVREIASVGWKETEHLENRLMKTTKGLLFATGGVFLFAGVGAAYLLPHMVKIPDAFQWDFTLAILLLSVWGMLRYHYALPILVLRGRNRMIAYNGLELIQGAGRPILGTVMVLAHLGLVGITVGYALAEAAARFIAQRMCPIDGAQGKFDRDTFYRMLKFGGATGVISLSTMVTLYSSSYIVGWKMGVTQVAVYQCTIALPLLLMRLAYILFSNRLPGLISGLQRDYNTGLIKTTLKLHLMVLFGSGFFLFGVCLINEMFVTVWVGGELFAGTHFSLLFVIFLFMSIARHNGYTVWQARGRLKAMTVAHIIDVPVSVWLSVMFIDNMGLRGIALAFIIAALPSTIVSQFAFHNRSRI
jgi:O-antigen/teichoic acid export membrane protein